MMSRISRDSQLGILLLVLMVGVTAAGVIQETRSQSTSPPLASFSTAPDGSKALHDWLSGLGHQVHNDVNFIFVIPERTDIVLMLQPTAVPTNEEWAAIDRWVTRGGTFIMAGNNLPTLLAINHFDMSMRRGEFTEAPVLVTPLLVNPPPILLPTTIEPAYYFDYQAADILTLLAADDRPIMVSFQRGTGRIILSTLIEPFTNRGLQSGDYPQLVLNILGRPARTIWFDEWHHGVRPETAGDGRWLQTTPTGWAILYIGLVIFISLLLRGQLFGRPVSISTGDRRRSPMEYVTAMANLSRRAGHRTAVMREVHHRLKRNIGHRYRLSAALPDDTFLTRLQQLNPDVEIDTLRTLLTNLSQKEASEAAFIKAVKEASEWEENFSHPGR